VLKPGVLPLQPTMEVKGRGGVALSAGARWGRGREAIVSPLTNTPQAAGTTELTRKAGGTGLFWVFHRKRYAQITAFTYLFLQILADTSLASRLADIIRKCKSLI